MTTKHTTTHLADLEPWIGMDSACKHLGISKPTMHRWIKAKLLKPKRTPKGDYRFRRSELDTLLN